MVHILGVDYGDARTGLAMSDPTGMLASGAGVVTAYTPEKTAEAVAARARTLGAQQIVLGYPRNMNGTEGPRAEKTKLFAGILEKISGLPIILWDERGTTTDAHRILSENGRSGKKRKQAVDEVAAVLILQGYLDKLRGGSLK